MVEEQRDFDYLLILDFEATCDDKGTIEVPEIIEFPVIILDTQTKKINQNYFHYYIKPVLNPVLTPFCIKLTKINQQQVDEGIILEDALFKLDDFLKVNGILDKRFSFVTVGNADFQEILIKECTHKNILYQDYLKRFFNLKNTFRFGMKLKKQSLKLPIMLRKLGMTFQGIEHSGIDDAKNTARIVQELLLRGIEFKKKYERDLTKIDLIKHANDIYY